MRRRINVKENKKKKYCFNNGILIYGAWGNVLVSLGIFSVIRPTEPCALRSNQPLKVSTRDFSWGKGGRCVWLTTYHPCSAETSRKSGALSYPEPLGSPRPVAGNFYYPYFIWRGKLKLSSLVCPRVCAPTIPSAKKLCIFTGLFLEYFGNSQLMKGLEV